jgi:hypothetical protein
MAAAFTSKGASTYMGWNGSVSLDYVDRAAADLITNLCSRGMTVNEAALETMTEIGPDPYWGASLKFHPRESSGQTIAELTTKTTGD